MRREMKFAYWIICLALASSTLRTARGSEIEPPPVVNAVPDEFPRFVVPGFQREMDLLRNLFWLHYQPAGPLLPLWDDWIPPATLWPAIGPNGAQEMRARWVSALASRPMDAEGYVSSMQHDGPAHAGGWPFPQWQKHGGVGWHFRGTGVPGYDPKPATTNGWELTGAEAQPINERGWVIELQEPKATAVTPSFELPAHHGPWLRLNWWAEGLVQANCYVEWTTTEHTEFSPERRFYFTPASPDGEQHTYMPMGGAGGKLVTLQGEQRTMIPVYRLNSWSGTITRLRLGFNNPGPAKVVIKSFHTAHDTRHTVNNLNFIRGVHHYFVWTRDLNLLRSQIARARKAMRFVMHEFQTEKRNCIYTTWRGHEGRSGVRRTADGQKQLFTGEGVGGNYWDLLPFGGEDALATIYYFDTLHALATLEENIAAHPEWGIFSGGDAFDAGYLRRHANAVREYATERFWNKKTGRFGTVDLDGVLHDYGWTFLNNEAVFHDFARDWQARQVRDWISGRRTVSNDTSTNADIYHWRFAPRASTLRNLDYYYWGWPSPETNAWGARLQDGGAVLGFSYHDLMCRLKVDGPDDAWKRLKELVVWFGETQAEGGYRQYYANDKSRGTAQGGKEPGGIGLDMEFFESVLPPQVILYGFMGFQPTPQGFRINPRLPKDWRELKITRVHLHDVVLELTARSDGTIVLRSDRSSEFPMVLNLPEGKWSVDVPQATVRDHQVTMRLPAGEVEFKRVQ